MIEAGEADRILLLSIPAEEIVEALALKATEGVVVGIGDDAAVRQARRRFRDFENVMFIEASPDGIPWRDQFFTRAFSFGGEWNAAEVARVLVAGVSVEAAG